MSNALLPSDPSLHSGDVLMSCVQDSLGKSEGSQIIVNRRRSIPPPKLPHVQTEPINLHPSSVETVETYERCDDDDDRSGAQLSQSRLETRCKGGDASSLAHVRKKL